MKLLIADSRSIIREAFCNLLEEESGYDVIGDVSSEDALWAFLQKSRPEVLLLSTGFYDNNGEYLIHKLVATYPQLKLVVLGQDRTSRHATTLTSTGVMGYLSENGSRNDLFHVLDNVKRDKISISLVVGKPETPVLREPGVSTGIEESKSNSENWEGVPA